MLLCSAIMKGFELLSPVYTRGRRMLRWASQRFSSEGLRQIISWSWFFIVKILCGLGFPLLAIRYIIKGNLRRVSGGHEDDSTSEESFSGEDSDTVPAPVPPLEQKSQMTLEEEEFKAERGASPTDDYFCEYDSTWDTDDSQEDNLDHSQEESEQSADAHFRHFFPRGQSFKYARFQSAARDLQNYRHDYPGYYTGPWCWCLRCKSFEWRRNQVVDNLEDQFIFFHYVTVTIKPRHWWSFEASDATPNLDFYLGKRPSIPDNLYISDFHTLWREDYDTLESVHSYIQWLFPLQEPGVNPEASTLTKQEIEEFCQNHTARKHLLESYKLMLDFYGIELCDEKTGEVKRAANWKNRFNNLNRRTHNNLRITRILKCMGTLGFAHYQAPLVHFFLEETLVNRELPEVKDSVLNYFLFAVLDKKQRRSLLKFAYLNFNESEEFVWCPKKMQMKWSSLKASKQPQVYDEDLCDN